MKTLTMMVTLGLTFAANAAPLNQKLVCRNGYTGKAELTIEPKGNFSKVRLHLNQNVAGVPGFKFPAEDVVFEHELSACSSSANDRAIIRCFASRAKIEASSCLEETTITPSSISLTTEKVANIGGEFLNIRLRAFLGGKYHEMSKLFLQSDCTLE